MSTELNDIKKKASAYLAMTDTRSGSSEAEAMFAAKKLGELMEAYDLSLDELNIRDEKVRNLSVPTGSKVKSQPQGELARAVSSFCDCSYYYYTNRGYVIAVGGKYKGRQRWGIKEISWHFVGLETDAEMAKYLYTTLLSAMNNDTNKFMKLQDRSYHGHNRVARSSFEDGFAGRVSDRLRQMKRLREEELAKRATSTALVTTKNQMIKSFLAETVGKLISIRTNTTRGTNFNGNAFDAGRKAANNASLSRPIGSEGRNQLLLS